MGDTISKPFLSPYFSDTTTRIRAPTEAVNVNSCSISNNDNSRSSSCCIRAATTTTVGATVSYRTVNTSTFIATTFQIGAKTTASISSKTILSTENNKDLPSTYRACLQITQKDQKYHLNVESKWQKVSKSNNFLNQLLFFFCSFCICMIFVQYDICPFCPLQELPPASRRLFQVVCLKFQFSRKSLNSNRKSRQKTIKKRTLDRHKLVSMVTTLLISPLFKKARWTMLSN